MKNCIKNIDSHKFSILIVMMGSKGPKISSLMMGESRGGFSIMVGAMYLKSTTSSTMLVGFSGKNLPIMYYDELSTLPNES